MAEQDANGEPQVVTRDTNGVRYTVATPYADAVDGFLRDLAATGYQIKSVQGYSPRNIAGTSTPSFHAYGAAIDVNPGENPVNGTSNLPANVGEIASRYGLGWGGNWTGAKRDPMHFSFARSEGGAFDVGRNGSVAQAVDPDVAMGASIAQQSMRAAPQPPVDPDVAAGAAIAQQSMRAVTQPQPDPDVALGASMAKPPATAPASNAGASFPRLTQEQMASGVDPQTGQPLVTVSAANPNDPIVQSLGKVMDNTRLPGPGVQAAASLPAADDSQRRVYASLLFPNMPAAQAQARIFTGPDGRLAAVDEKGNPFYIQPERPDASRLATLSPNNLAGWVSSGAGPAMPQIGAALGGVAGTPGSPASGIALAGAGAALGDQARQYLARQYDPTASVNPLQTAAEAGIGAAGQTAGGVVNHLLAPNPLRVPAVDLRQLRSPLTQAQVAQNYANANAQGVRITPGQASGMRSLLQYEDAAQNNPEFAGLAADFYRTQGNELTGAGNRLLDQISPVTDKTAAAQQFQQGADDAIRAARQQANAAARPSYTAAQGRGQVLSPDLAQLMDQPAVQAAMKSARVQYQNLYRAPAPDTPDFRLWDLTKRSLDDAYSVAARAGERTQATALDSLRGDLVTHLDAAYPEYATARATAAPGQQLAARLEDSGTGTTADAVGTERAKAITGPVFNQSPDAVAESKAAFKAAGRYEDWMTGVRANLQDAFERASMSQQGLNPAMLRRQVWANTDNRDAMKAAMEPWQYEGFNNFMQTVENVAQTYPQNSLTAMRGNAGAAINQAGAGQANVKAWQMAGNVTSPFRIADLPGRIVDAGARRAQAANIRQIMGDLFSPQGEAYLRDMAAVSPGSQRAIALTSQFMARYGGRALQAASAAQGPQQSPNFLNSAVNPAVNAVLGTNLPVWSRANRLVPAIAQ